MRQQFIGLAAGLISALPVGADNGYMMGNWGGHMGWLGSMGWVSMILFWMIVIALVVALVKWLLFAHQRDINQLPLEILKERYAKGEIDQEEFEQRKSVLLNH